MGQGHAEARRNRIGGAVAPVLRAWVGVSHSGDLPAARLRLPIYLHQRKLESLSAILPGHKGRPFALERFPFILVRSRRN